MGELSNSKNEAVQSPYFFSVLLSFHSTLDEEYTTSLKIFQNQCGNYDIKSSRINVEIII
jgi:hypothetical protein